MNALFLYRIGHVFHRRGWRRVAKAIDHLNRVATRCSIPSSSRIGEGAAVAYGGMAIVIHANAVVGKGCLIGQAVTIGAREAYVSEDAKACPRIGDDVYIAAGARVLGDIEIGARSIIGANAVVLQSFPPHSVIAGMPARRVGETSADYRAIVRSERHDA